MSVTVRTTEEVLSYREFWDGDVLTEIFLIGQIGSMRSQRGPMGGPRSRRDDEGRKDRRRP